MTTFGLPTPTAPDIFRSSPVQSAEPLPRPAHQDWNREGRGALNTPPLPRARPNPYKWNPEWWTALQRGEQPEELELWLEEQIRIEQRDPEFRAMVERKREELRDFKQRFQGWLEEAQRALRPGRDI